MNAVRLKCLLLAFLALIFVFREPAYAKEKEKILLDSDMVEAFDDGFAMLLLAKSPNIELLGVTTLSGNSWVEQGTAWALRQLEDAGRSDVPVAAGLEYPLRPNRHKLFELERKFLGRGHDLWTGSFGLEKPTSWQAAYEKSYGCKPTLKPIAKHAVNFILSIEKIFLVEWISKLLARQNFFHTDRSQLQFHRDCARQGHFYECCFAVTSTRDNGIRKIFLMPSISSTPSVPIRVKSPLPPLDLAAIWPWPSAWRQTSCL